MGQTQLLLVVLGVLLVGVAIFVGVSMFEANTVENTRNAIMADLNAFASRAHAYYWKPTTQGGGNKSFVGVTMGMIYPMVENANARYYLDPAFPPTETDCTIIGMGKIVASNGDSIKVRIRITEPRNWIEILN
jgi:hypothetical protein